MSPVSFHLPFPFVLPPLPGLSRSACFDLFPRPPVGGGAGGCRFAAAGGGPVGLPVIMAMPLSRYRSFAFLVGLRLLASLLAWFRHRLCCRVISYSIPDEMMRITGSCGISVGLSCLRT